MRPAFPRWPLLALLGLCAAFENFWMWSDSGIAFGMPANLAYHVGLCGAAAVVLLAVVRRGWPDDADGD